MIVRIATKMWIETDSGVKITKTDRTETTIPFQDKWSVRAAINQIRQDLWATFGKMMKLV